MSETLRERVAMQMAYDTLVLCTGKKVEEWWMTYGEITRDVWRKKADAILAFYAEDRRELTNGDVSRTADEWRTFLHNHSESEWEGGLLQETLIDDMEIVEARLAEAAEDRRALVENLKEYGCHASFCPLSDWRAGRPTKDGGYETNYGGKWYQGDNKPLCTCGLDAALKAAGEV